MKRNFVNKKVEKTLILFILLKMERTWKYFLRFTYLYQKSQIWGHKRQRIVESDTALCAIFPIALKRNICQYFLIYCLCLFIQKCFMIYPILICHSYLHTHISVFKMYSQNLSCRLAVLLFSFYYSALIYNIIKVCMYLLSDDFHKYTINSKTILSFKKSWILAI